MLAQLQHHNPTLVDPVWFSGKGKSPGVKFLLMEASLQELEVNLSKETISVI